MVQFFFNNIGSNTQVEQMVSIIPHIIVTIPPPSEDCDDFPFRYSTVLYYPMETAATSYFAFSFIQLLKPSLTNLLSSLNLLQMSCIESSLKGIVIIGQNHTRSTAHLLLQVRRRLVTSFSVI
ncbi:hypothetical protein FGO68_gene15046 [Halteria grandinella]|uniref:Uncharacterized protein n=1 Tax=Halteria grandinella TaxID=5974 RepID=A0A8J8NT42_HALGN|nr:hypothetical protein FGO68_gene15046 [Halteria grandinella]